MSYEISYGITSEKKTISANKRVGIAVLGALLVVLATLARFFYPDETRQLSDALFPLTSETTQQALKTFSQNIREGDSFGDAVAAFCQEIVDESDAS